MMMNVVHRTFDRSHRSADGDGGRLDDFCRDVDHFDRGSYLADRRPIVRDRRPILGDRRPGLAPPSSNDDASASSSKSGINHPIRRRLAASLVVERAKTFRPWWNWRAPPGVSSGALAPDLPRRQPEQQWTLAGGMSRPWPKRLAAWRSLDRVAANAGRPSRGNGKLAATPACSLVAAIALAESGAVPCCPSASSGLHRSSSSADRRRRH